MLTNLSHTSPVPYSEIIQEHVSQLFISIRRLLQMHPLVDAAQGSEPSETSIARSSSLEAWLWGKSEERGLDVSVVYFQNVASWNRFSRIFYPTFKCREELIWKSPQKYSCGSLWVKFCYLVKIKTASEL